MLKYDIKITQIDGASCQENTPQALDIPVQVSRGFSFSERTFKMKTAKTISELAQEIERQENSKKDFIGNTKIIRLTDEGKLDLGIDRALDVTKHCHGQISARTKIPKVYYDRMLVDDPTLLSTNVNHWFDRAHENRMVRTLDGDARAFLSNKYRPLDNFDLLQTALPIFSEKQCDIKSCEVTPNKMYLKVLFPKMEAEIKVGDPVQAGICLSNSEVGDGSLAVDIFMLRLVCMNGMISSNSMRKYHVGRSQAADVQHLLQERTKDLNDAAYWSSVRDVIAASFDETAFLAEVGKLKESTERKIESPNMVKVVEATQRKFNFTDSQGNDIMKHLCQGGDFSQYGLIQAVTRTAEDQVDYDEATSLERAGGKIVELAPKDWNAIAKAA